MAPGAPVFDPGGAEQHEQRRPDQRRRHPAAGGPAPHAGLRGGHDERQRHEQQVDRDLGDDRDRAGVEREVERVPRTGEEAGGERRQRHERRPGAADRDEQHQRDVEAEQREQRRRRGELGPRQGAVQADVGDDGRDEHGHIGAEHPGRVVVDAEPIADERDDRVGDGQHVRERQHADVLAGERGALEPDLGDHARGAGGGRQDQRADVDRAALDADQEQQRDDADHEARGRGGLDEQREREEHQSGGDDQPGACRGARASDGCRRSSGESGHSRPSTL